MSTMGAAPDVCRMCASLLRAGGAAASTGRQLHVSAAVHGSPKVHCVVGGSATATA